VSRDYTAFQSVVHAPRRPCHSDYTTLLRADAADSTQAACMTSDSQTAVTTTKITLTRKLLGKGKKVNGV